jgi:hypothetical protein
MTPDETRVAHGAPAKTPKALRRPLIVFGTTKLGKRAAKSTVTASVPVRDIEARRG